MCYTCTQTNCVLCVLCMCLYVSAFAIYTDARLYISMCMQSTCIFTKPFILHFFSFLFHCAHQIYIFPIHLFTFVVRTSLFFAYTSFIIIVIVVSVFFFFLFDVVIVQFIVVSAIIEIVFFCSSFFKYCVTFITSI